MGKVAAVAVIKEMSTKLNLNSLIDIRFTMLKNGMYRKLKPFFGDKNFAQNNILNLCKNYVYKTKLGYYRYSIVLQPQNNRT